MKIFVLLTLVTLASCSSMKDGSKTPDKSTLAQESLLGTNWYQTAGEMEALYIQGYNIARLRFDEAMKKKGKKVKAVVVDIDETVLDNSPFQAKSIEEQSAYPKYWKEWISSSSARALPGAVEFLNYVTRNKGKVFYISNRKDTDLKATLKNLKDQGFPVVASQVMLRTAESDKTQRRSAVLKNYDIVLLVGDNLNDFDGIFEHKSVEDRNALVHKMRGEFGKRFIMLPNPLYGDWEGAMYNYDYRLSDEQKHEKRMKALRSF